MKQHIIARLEDLLVQATRERTHYYVAGCVRDAISKITRLREENERLRSQVSEYHASYDKCSADHLKATLELKRLREELGEVRTLVGIPFKEQRDRAEELLLKANKMLTDIAKMNGYTDYIGNDEITAYLSEREGK